MQTSFNTVKELEAPIKATRFFYLFDICFIGIYGVVTYQLKFLVYSSLTIPYLLFCLLWGIYFILPAPYNKKRKNWQNIIITMIAFSEKKKYYPYAPNVEEALEVK